MARKKLLAHSTNMYRVLKYMSDFPRPHAVMHIAESLNMPRPAINTALKELKDHNAVINVDLGIWQWSGDRSLLDTAIPERSIAERILKLFETHEQLTNKQMQDLLNITKSGAESALKQLVKSSKVLRHEQKIPGSVLCIYTKTNFTGVIEQFYVAPPPQRKDIAPHITEISPGLTRYSLVNARHWSHDTVGCIVPLAKGFSGLEKV